MVSYLDGSVMAQLGNPDMRTPIAHALAYPERISSGVAPLDLTQLAKLEFRRPDLLRFPCLQLAYDALTTGGSAPAVLNAANEVAVEAFLDGRIGFRQIDQLIARVMHSASFDAVADIAGLLDQDRHARQLAHSFLTT